MCCVLTSLFFIGPRAAVLIWWLLEPARWSATFPTFLWPLLGVLFLPWTTLAYVLVAPGGIVGFDWIWLTLGLVIDIAGWAGGSYGNRGRVRYAR